MKYTRLEDGKEYLIVGNCKYKNKTYIYLTNMHDKDDFCIRKLEDEYLIDLEDEDEFKKALLLFTRKYQDAFEYKENVTIV